MEALRLFDIQKCIHCGMCLPACPTYAETGNEAYSPRGRIYSLRAVALGLLDWEDIRPQLDTCLGCLACETACPSPLPYEKMLAVARRELERRLPPLRRALRHVFLRTVSSPRRARVASGVAEALPALGSAVGRLIGGGPLPQLPKRRVTTPGIFPAAGGPRGRVMLLPGCVQRVAQPEVNLAAARCLAANGFEVMLPEEPDCCGALLHHFGHPEEAREMAARAGQAWQGADALVVTSAGCGAYIKRHPSAPNLPTYDFAEFLWDRGWVARLTPPRGAPLRVALHDACHLEHGQGITDAPRRLLSLLPGIDPLELDENYCCGSAGVYGIFQPAMARRLLRRKLDAIERTEADIVLSSNPGCTLWIRQGLEERGLDTPVLHLAEIMALGLEPD
jgi:glycolate oxidase iron-sulfur subunit